MRNVWRRARAKWERISPRTHDVLLILISLGACVAVGVNKTGALVEGPAAAAIGVVATVALWWRRAYPARIVLLGFVVAVVAFVPALLAIGLFTYTIRRRDRSLVLMYAVTVLGLVLGPMRGNPVGFGDVFEAMFASLQCVLVGAYIGTRRDLITSLNERISRAEADREIRAEQARLSERSRIAREMHDVLAHKVSLIALHAGGLEVNPAVGSERVAQSASLIRTTARQALEDLRGVLGVLRSDRSPDGTDLAPQPTIGDMDRLVASSREAGVPVRLELDVPELPEPLGRTAYRVVQESLTNVHKHARGAATTVSVHGQAGHGLTVEVCNKRPVAVDTLLPGSGAGLIGLRERVELLGGTLHSGPADDGGWNVTAWLPWAPVEAADMSIEAAQ